MSDLKTRFEAATANAKKLPSRPSNEDLLALYAFYKQATTGDVTGERPGFMDFAGGAKYDAWDKLKGMSKDDAMEKYIARVEQLGG